MTITCGNIVYNNATTKFEREVMKLTTTQDLLKMGYSKYKIGKEVGVSWNTVSLWSKNVFKPTEEHQKELERLANEKK